MTGEVNELIKKEKKKLEYPIKITVTKHSMLGEVDFNNIPFGKYFSDHMFVADYHDGKWQNCEIMPFQNISLNPSTSALHYGQAIFEGMKAFKDQKGQPQLFRPIDNFKRFNISAKRMAMPEVPEEIFISGLKELIKLDAAWIPTGDDCSLYIRPVMFATDDHVGVRVSESYKLVIFTSPAGAYYTKPVKVLVADKYVRAASGGVGYAKAAGNYGAALLPTKEAQAKGYDQIIWMDAKEFKYVQESGTMNVFFVINNVVITPELDGSILDGVTRRSVIQLLRDKGIRVEERKISMDEVYTAYKNGTLQEAFGVGTAATIAHIAIIGYNDEDLILPQIETRKFSPHLKNELQDIRTSKIPDAHGWMVKL